MNQDLQVEFKGNFLKNKTIALGISGSIAATQSIKIIRELRRYQARVLVFPTDESLKFIGEKALAWASAEKVITTLSGGAEHIFSVDLLLIAPASLNVINKIANGIADNPLTTLAQSILGVNQAQKKIPFLFFPAMHNSLASNPFLKESIKKLESHNATFLISQSSLAEKKIKIPDHHYIVAQVLHHYHRNKNQWQVPKKVFITTGAVPSYIDPIRIISNHATGSTGIALGEQFFYSGLNPYLLAPISLKKTLPTFLEEVDFYESYEDYQKKCLAIFKKNNAQFSLFLSLAAVSDFSSANKAKRKISSSEALTLTLKPNQKVIQELKKAYSQVPFVLFKLTTQLTPEEISALAQGLLNNYEYVVINLREDLEKFKKYFFSQNQSKVITSLEELGKLFVDLIKK